MYTAITSPLPSHADHHNLSAVLVFKSAQVSMPHNRFTWFGIFNLPSLLQLSPLKSHSPPPFAHVGPKRLYHTEINSHRRPNTNRRNNKLVLFWYPQKHFWSVANSWRLPFCAFPKKKRQSLSGELEHSNELLPAGSAPVSLVVLAPRSLGHQGKMWDLM